MNNINAFQMIQSLANSPMNGLLSGKKSEQSDSASFLSLLFGLFQGRASDADALSLQSPFFTDFVKQVEYMLDDPDVTDELKQLLVQWLALMNIRGSHLQDMNAVHGAAQSTEHRNYGISPLSSNVSVASEMLREGNRQTVSHQLTEWMEQLPAEQRQALLRLVSNAVIAHMSEGESSLREGRPQVFSGLTQHEAISEARSSLIADNKRMSEELRTITIQRTLDSLQANVRQNAPTHVGQVSQEAIAPVSNGELSGSGELVEENVQRISGIDLSPLASSTSETKGTSLQRVPVTLHQLLSQTMPQYIMRHIQVSPDGVSQARLSLYPEQLGQVDVHIRSHNGVVAAQFIAETWMAKELLESQLEQLRQLLQNQGLDVEKLSVSIGQGKSHFQQYNGSHTDESQKYRQDDHTLSTDSIQLYAEQDTSEVEAWRNPHSSVNFTA